jgi:tetratricopeptide (TPR) repeat protein
LHVEKKNRKRNPDREIWEDMMNTVNNVPERETELVHSIRLTEESKGSNCPDVVRLLNELGSLYEWRREYSEAERIYRRSLSLINKIESEERNIQRLRIRTICNLGRILRAQGRYEKAEQEFFKALVIANKTFGPAHLEWLGN